MTFLIKLVLLYLATIQLCFGYNYNSTLRHNVLPSFNANSHLVKIIEKFNKAEDFSSLSKNVTSSFVLDKLDSIKTAKTPLFRIHNDYIVIQLGHLLTHLKINIENSTLEINKQIINLNTVKDQNDLFNKILNITNPKKVSSFELIIPSAQAAIVVGLLLAISVLAVIDSFVAAFSNLSCTDNLNKSFAKVTKIKSQCETDMANVLASQASKNDTDTNNYLENINKYMENLREDSEATDCKEAVESKFKFWNLYRFSTCMGIPAGKGNTITGNQFCKQVEKTEKCLYEYKNLNPSSISTSSQEKQLNGSDSAEQSSGSDSSQQ